MGMEDMNKRMADEVESRMFDEKGEFKEGAFEDMLAGKMTYSNDSKD